jgi:hypothetical protein
MDDLAGEEDEEAPAEEPRTPGRPKKQPKKGSK